MPTATYQAVEEISRHSYGRLMAFLSGRTGDLAAVEDALSESFLAALEQWPKIGIPAKPDSWLLLVAKRRLIDKGRHKQVEERIFHDLCSLAEKAIALTEEDMPFPDERLNLMLLCAHPALDSSIHAPLMLQCVLGLSAERIAKAFLVNPSAMGQSLSRAKAKIRDTHMRFEMPDDANLPQRLQAALNALYAAFGSGWDDAGGAESSQQGLAQEAIELCSLVVQKMPDQPEAHGLLALMLFCQSRQGARHDTNGSFIPLAQQDPQQWSMELIKNAESLLFTAAQQKKPGRFQLEAAIQSMHAKRAFTGITDWKTIAHLYEALVHVEPSVGAFVARSAAFAEAYGTETGLRTVQALPLEAVQYYQPYWALLAHLSVRSGHNEDAQKAYTKAIELSSDPATRNYLHSQLCAIMP